jgi:hypothetical protein
MKSIVEEARDTIKQYAEEVGDDHPVNICNCSLIRLSEQLDTMAKQWPPLLPSYSDDIGFAGEKYMERVFSPKEFDDRFTWRALWNVLRNAAISTQQKKPDAYMTEDGQRVIKAESKDTAFGATAAALENYTVPLYR